MYDFCIIGGGVIGCAVARELTRYKTSVAVVEAREDVCTGASGANSGIIHAGYDPLPKTLKAVYNATGAKMFPAYAAALGVPFVRTGSLLVAFGDDGKDKLRTLLDRGEKNGIKNLRVIRKEDALAIEPRVSPDLTAALYASDAGITNPFAFTFALKENAEKNGAHFEFGFEVVSCKTAQGGISLLSSTGARITAKRVVNCAGEGAGPVARALGDLVYMKHRLGEYILFDAPSAVGMPVFGVPDEKGKGVVVAPAVSGKFFIGPTSVEVGRVRPYFRREAVRELFAAAEKLVPGLGDSPRLTRYSGIRTASGDGDFRIFKGSRENVWHMIGIDSPGITAAPAIATSFARSFGLERDPAFDPVRRPTVKLSGKSAAEKRALIARDPRYGNIVCRCECVSEAEVTDAVRRGARTLDGVKKRLGTGMGKCQGSGCDDKIIAILSRELGKPVTEIDKNVRGSELYLGEGT